MLENLQPLIGGWTMTPVFENLPPAEGHALVDFDWMSGGGFLIERWTVPIPEAPDGLAVIGVDPQQPDQFLQHYFDSRAVARVYRMTFDGRVWRLWRDEADLTPCDFGQRFTGTLSDDGMTIDATWEICHDGSTWEKDFDLTYRRR